MAHNKKKGLIAGILVTVVLMLELSMQFVPMTHTRIAVLSEIDAERISGNFFTHAIVNPVSGSNSSGYGADIIEYASYSTTAQNSSIFIETVYMFNSTLQASIVYHYFAQELTTGNMNQVGNSDYRGFFYSYMIHAKSSMVPKNSYNWGVCGMNDLYVFDINGYSHLKPTENIGSIAKDQINAMEVLWC